MSTARLPFALAGAAAGAAAGALSIKALAILGAGVGGLVLVLSPWGPYLAALLSLPFWIPLGGGLSVARLALGTALALMILNALQRRGPWPVAWRWPEGHLGLALMGAVVASVLVNGPGRTAGEGGAWLMMGLYYFLTLTYVRTPGDVRRTAWVLIGLGVFEAGVVAAQAYLGLTLTVGQIDHVAEWEAGSRRLYGTTGHATVLAGFLQIPMLYAGALLVGRRAGRLSPVVLVALTAMTWAWTHTYSRTTVLGFGAALLAAGLIRYRWIRVVTLGAAGAGLLALIYHDFSVFALIHTLERKVAFLAGLTVKSQGLEAAETLRWRVEQWVAALGLFREHPLFGVGPGLAGEQLFPHFPPDSRYFESLGLVVHNAFLQMATEMGVLALAAGIGLWAIGFLGALRAARAPKLRFEARVWLVILVGQLVTALLNPMMREPFVVIAICVCLWRMSQASAAEDPGPRGPAARAELPGRGFG